MLTPELEKLIDLAVADGEITDQERRVLYKKLQEAGADPEEFEFVLNSKLKMVRNRMKAQAAQAAQAQAQAAQAAQAQAQAQAQAMQAQAPTHAPKKSNKIGEMKKCPACGAPYTAGSLYCAECGHEFTGMQGNSSVERFSEMLREIEMRNANNETALKGVMNKVGLGGSGRVQEICTSIQTFPIPNSKEDLLEFILFLKSKAEKKVKRGLVSNVTSMGSAADEAKIVEAYKTKYDESIEKARFYIDDPQLVERLKQNGINIGEKTGMEKFKSVVGFGLPIGILLLLIGLITQQAESLMYPFFYMTGMALTLFFGFKFVRRII